MAIRTALYFAQEEGMDRIIVASDCLSVVQRLSARDRDRSGCGPVIEDIKRLATHLALRACIMCRLPLGL